jgi:hypothetical protein
MIRRAEGQPAPDEEPKTYPHISVPIDIRHALSGKYDVRERPFAPSLRHFTIP